MSRDAEPMPPADGMPGEDSSLVDVLKRAFKSFQAHKMTDHAAGLTYYAMMSLFPALLAMVSVLGLIGTSSLVTDAVDYARDNGADASVTDAIQSSLEGAISKSGGAVSIALVLGIVISLNGASGAFAAAGRALNIVYGVEDQRGFLKAKLQTLAFTLAAQELGLQSAGHLRVVLSLPGQSPKNRPGIGFGQELGQIAQLPAKVGLQSTGVR